VRRLLKTERAIVAAVCQEISRDKPLSRPVRRFGVQLIRWAGPRGVLFDANEVLKEKVGRSAGHMRRWLEKLEGREHIIRLRLPFGTPLPYSKCATVRHPNGMRIIVFMKIHRRDLDRFRGVPYTEHGWKMITDLKNTDQKRPEMITDLCLKGKDESRRITEISPSPISSPVPVLDFGVEGGKGGELMEALG